MKPASQVLLVLAFLLAASTATPAEPIEAHWNSATHGSWVDPAHWSISPTFPNNGAPHPGDTYDAYLDAIGSSFLVTLDQSVAVNSVTLRYNAGLRHVAGTLTLTAGMNVPTPWNYQLLGGTLAGGTLSIDPTFFLPVARGTLAAVTVNGSLQLDVAATLSVRDGLTLNGSIATDGTSALTPSTIAFVGSQTLGGNAAIVLNGKSANVPSVTLTPDAPGQEPVLTIGPGATIRTGLQGGFIGPTAEGAGGIVNHGTISAQSAGKTLTVSRLKSSDGTLTASNGGRLYLQSAGGNLGNLAVATGSTIEADGDYTIDRPVTAPLGSTLIFSGTWRNLASVTAEGADLALGTPATGELGTISLTNSTLRLCAAYTTAQLRSIHRAETPARIMPGGILDNAGQTLIVETDNFRLEGGSIRGGTITTSAGTPLVVAAPAQPGFANVIEGTSLDADVALVARLSLKDVNFTPGRTISLESGAALNLLDSVTGTVQAVFNGNGTDVVSAAATLPADFTVRTGASSGTIGYATDVVTNRGLISAQTPLKMITVASTLHNDGTLEARNGAWLVVKKLSGNLGNVVLAPGSTLDLDGDYTVDRPRAVADGATLILRGNWSNSAGISANNATVSFGTIPANLGSLAIANSTVGIVGSLTTAQVNTIPRTTSALAIFSGGIVENDNATLVADADTPLLQLRGGLVRGGTLAATAGSTIEAALSYSNSIGTDSGLSGVTLAADLAIRTRCSVRILNGLTLANATIFLDGGVYGATLASARNQAITGTGQILFDGTDTYYSALDATGTTLTLGPDVVVATGRGNGYLKATIVNQGTVSARTKDRRIILNAVTLTNTGIVEARNGGNFWASSSKVTNLSNATLTGGTWAAYANSGLWLTNNNTPITTNAATVLLSGPGSDFREINALQTNNGSFTVTDARAFTTAGALANNGTLTVGPDATLAVTGPLTGTGTTTVASTANLTAGAVRQGVFNLGGQATVRPAAQGGQTSALNALNLAGDFGAWAARLDLADNALVLHYTTDSPLARTASQIRSAYHGGDWQGPGLTTSAATPNTALAYGEAADVLNLTGAQTATFAGQTVDATTVLVRLTLQGDANLDGAVDFADLVRLAQNYNVVSPAAAHWPDGDFTYDGQVNFDDLVKLAQNYNALPPPAGALPSGFQSDLGAAFAAVPEPSGAALLAWAALRTRRRPRRVTRSAGSSAKLP